jgi:hypothetical protein
VLPVKFAHRFHRGTLLLPQALPHLRPERRPIVGADVRFETRCQQRANRCKHRLTAVHTYGALRSAPRARSCRRRLRRWGRLCLHLRRYRRGRLGLPSRRQRRHRAQSNQQHLSLKFFHAFCRSPHSGPVDYSISACRGSPHGRAYLGAVYVLVLRHLANLQAPNALRQGIPLLLCEPAAASASPRCPQFFAMRVDCWAGTTLAPGPGIC